MIKPQSIVSYENLDHERFIDSGITTDKWQSSFKNQP